LHIYLALACPQEVTYKAHTTWIVREDGAHHECV